MNRKKRSILQYWVCLIWPCLFGCGYAQWPITTPELTDANAYNFEHGKEKNERRDRSIKVERGQSVFSISRRYKVPIKSIIKLNSLRPPFLLIVGQRLLLPRPGREYTVREGDTLFAISRRHNIDPFRLAQLNGIHPPYKIFVKQKITLISDLSNNQETAKPSLINVKKLKPVIKLRKEKGSVKTEVEGAGRRKLVKKVLERKKVISLKSKTVMKSGGGRGRGFIWPVRGKVISKYGTKSRGLRNDGINIRAKRGSPVFAAESGVVAYAGNELRGFGNLLLIKHEGGWITAYAHNEKLLVKRGETLKRGQKIATVGSSGNVSTPQLHFELRLGRSAKNPSNFIKHKLS